MLEKKRDLNDKVVLLAVTAEKAHLSYGWEMMEKIVWASALGLEMVQS